jgi:hypothetical protein
MGVETNGRRGWSQRSQTANRSASINPDADAAGSHVLSPAIAVVRARQDGALGDRPGRASYA